VALIIRLTRLTQHIRTVYADTVIIGSATYSDSMYFALHEPAWLYCITVARVRLCQSDKLYIRLRVYHSACNNNNKLECGPMPNVMAALPNIGGALCCNVWLTPTTRVSCSNAANIAERKTWTQSEFCTLQDSVRGQEPPKMCI